MNGHAHRAAGGDVDVLVDRRLDDRAAVARRDDERMARKGGADVARQRLLPIERAVVGPVVGPDREVDGDGLAHRVGHVEEELDAAEHVVGGDGVGVAADPCDQNAGLRGHAFVDGIRPGGAGGDEGPVAFDVLGQRGRVGRATHLVDVGLGPDGARDDGPVVGGGAVASLEVGVLAARGRREVEQPRDPSLALVEEVGVADVDARVGDADERSGAGVARRARRDGADVDARGVEEQEMERGRLRRANPGARRRRRRSPTGSRGAARGRARCRGGRRPPRPCPAAAARWRRARQRPSERRPPRRGLRAGGSSRRPTARRGEAEQRRRSRGRARARPGADPRPCSLSLPVSGARRELPSRGRWRRARIRPSAPTSPIRRRPSERSARVERTRPRPRRGRRPGGSSGSPLPADDGGGPSSARRSLRSKNWGASSRKSSSGRGASLAVPRTPDEAAEGTWNGGDSDSALRPLGPWRGAPSRTSASLRRRRAGEASGSPPSYDCGSLQVSVVSIGLGSVARAPIGCASRRRFTSSALLRMRRVRSCSMAPWMTRASSRGTHGATCSSGSGGFDTRWMMNCSYVGSSGYAGRPASIS